ncbi:hypothetical protein P5673_024747 [Acropora cervicornis]|uniref:Uncharacterized protein n=1 Tax=Acropora cervicornis TaxID=6130 RepID=A0AAD9Q309_ACRCE|nr:hypothetical protein P5673_024747 [Acropora cervicornis]
MDYYLITLSAENHLTLSVNEFTAGILLSSPASCPILSASSGIEAASMTFPIPSSKLLPALLIPSVSLSSLFGVEDITDKRVLASRMAFFPPSFLLKSLAISLWLPTV